MLDHVYLTTTRSPQTPGPQYTNPDVAYARNITRYYDLVGQQKLKTNQNTLELRNTTRWLYHTTEDDLIILKNFP